MNHSFEALDMRNIQATGQPGKDAHDLKFVLTVIAVVLVVTSLPYLYGYLSTPPDKQFMGIMLDAPDHGQYFSWMRELTSANLAANKLTPEPNRPVFFNLLWWGMGRLGQLTGLDYAGMYQLLRFSAGGLFLLLVYRVCTWFFDDRFMRRTAFLITTLSSGLGWILIVLKYTITKPDLLFPLDVFIAEGNTFLGIMAYPHFIAAAFYIFVFDLVLQGQVKQQLRYAFAAGAVALFLGWQHAYDLVSVYGVLAAYAVLQTWRDRRLPSYTIKSGMIIGLLSWWPALYSVLLTSADPIWKKVLAQFANAGVYTPDLRHLPMLLGAAFVLALITAIQDQPLRQQRVNNPDLFLRGWFWVTFALIYLPVDYQVHLLNGWQVPIAILATRGLGRLVPIIRGWTSRASRPVSETTVRRWLIIGFVLFISLTNLYLWTWRFTELARHTYPYYLHRDELAAMRWLENNAKPDHVVLSSLTIGQYLPAMTGTYAFIAHWAQTIEFYDKLEMMERFFSPDTSDRDRQQILDRYRVQYVFCGPAERELGSCEFDGSSHMSLAFSTARVQVYQVTRGGR